MSDHLQSTKTDLARASELVEATLETLQTFRTDEEWDKDYKYMTDAASLFGITVTPLRPQRSRQVPHGMQDMVILESHESRNVSSISHSLKVSIYFQSFDSILSELKIGLTLKTLP